MRELKLGVTLPQFTNDAERFLDGARRAEDLGLDSVWVFDHLWPLGAKHRPILEAWTALAAVAAATDKIGIGTMVTRSSLRHPALLAAMASTVGTIAPGRLTVAIGSGDTLSRAENEAFGLPYFSVRERTSQLESTVRVLAASFDNGPVTQKDDFVAIEGLPTRPQSPAPPALWIGGWSEEVVRLAGAAGSGWNGWGGSPAKLRAAVAALRAAAGGRQVEISWGGQALLGPSDERALAKLGRRDPRAWLIGGPESIAARLADRANAGADHLILGFPDACEVGPYELLADEVAQRLPA